MIDVFAELMFRFVFRIIIILTMRFVDRGGLINKDVALQAYYLEASD